VATNERPSAPVCKIAPLPDLPLGGLEAALCGRRPPPSDCVASAACAAAKFSRASTTDASSPAAAPRASARSELAPSASTAAEPYRPGTAAAAFGARKEGTTGGFVARGRAGGDSAGSGPSWCGGVSSDDVPRQVGVLTEHVPAHRNFGLDQPAHRIRRGCKKGHKVQELGARQ